MPEPKSLKELSGLQGRLAYIRRFISNLAGRCQPFSHLMKKDAPFVWDDKCRKAFDNIKKYLFTAPVLRAPTQATPYALVYGVEAVLPLELQIPSMRIAIQEGLSSDENDKLRLAELEALDEKRLQAQQSLQCYQARLARAFNKKMCPRSFQKGDLVLAVRRPIITSHKTGSSSKRSGTVPTWCKKLTRIGHTRS
ncbi:unnamed protein product [Rhodiola kirilowii]